MHPLPVWPARKEQCSVTSTYPPRTNPSLDALIAQDLAQCYYQMWLDALTESTFGVRPIWALDQLYAMGIPGFGWTDVMKIAVALTAEVRRIVDHFVRQLLAELPTVDEEQASLRAPVGYVHDFPRLIGQGAHDGVLEQVTQVTRDCMLWLGVEEQQSKLQVGPAVDVLGSRIDCKTLSVRPSLKAQYSVCFGLHAMRCIASEETPDWARYVSTAFFGTIAGRLQHIAQVAQSIQPYLGPLWAAHSHAHREGKAGVRLNYPTIRRCIDGLIARMETDVRNTRLIRPGHIAPALALIGEVALPTGLQAGTHPGGETIGDATTGITQATALRGGSGSYTTAAWGESGAISGSTGSTAVGTGSTQAAALGGGQAWYLSAAGGAGDATSSRTGSAATVSAGTGITQAAALAAGEAEPRERGAGQGARITVRPWDVAPRVAIIRTDASGDIGGFAYEEKTRKAVYTKWSGDAKG